MIKLEEREDHPNSVPVERRTIQIERNGWINLKSVVGLISFFMIVLSVVIVYSKFGGPKEFKPNDIVSYHMRKDGCIELLPQEIARLKEDANWGQTHKSMHFWMSNMSRMEGITSFHVGNPYCYVLLKQVDGTPLGLFNVKFTGYYKHAIVSRNERSISCPDKVKNVDRAQTVYIEYNDETTGQVVVRVFNHTQSFVLQSTVFYLKGLSTCDDSDLGMKTLDKFIKG